MSTPPHTASAVSPTGIADSPAPLNEEADGGLRADDHDQAPEQPQSSSLAAGTGGPGCNLLVTKLPDAVNDEQLRRVFEPYGRIESCIVMWKSTTSTSRGFGFVRYKSAAEAQAALEALDGSELGSNKISVQKSEHDGRVQEGRAIFVRNIPREVAMEHVKLAIETTAGVAVGSMSTEPGGTRNVITATIDVGSVEAARRAIQHLHKRTFASIYAELSGVPPLATQPVGQPAVPEMLVKFAESAESLSQRHGKKRRGANPPQNAARPQPAVANARQRGGRGAGTRRDPAPHVFPRYGFGPAPHGAVALPPPVPHGVPVQVIAMPSPGMVPAGMLPMPFFQQMPGPQVTPVAQHVTPSGQPVMALLPGQAPQPLYQGQQPQFAQPPHGSPAGFALPPQTGADNPLVPANLHAQAQNPPSMP